MPDRNPLLTEAYDYVLPPHLIAERPAEPKDSARLLVYNRQTGETTHARFSDILDFIPPQSAILLNDTRVIKARIFGKKESGGKVELLLNSPMPQNHFLVYIRGRVKAGTKLYFDEGLEASVQRLHADGTRSVTFWHKGIQLGLVGLHAILERIGHVPLPPYIHREDAESDARDYQTLFAQHIGAVAAPTASLHFTEPLFEKLQERFETAYVTLHVGAGTFKPVETDEILDHTMHSEQYAIPPRTQKIIDSQKPILAVGTTVTRTVEYYVRHRESGGEANLFLHPGNPPQRVDHLLTNFHLPKSTLLMLVASFIGLEKTLDLYREAIEKEYRFFSYGDAMLII